MKENEDKQITRYENEDKIFQSIAGVKLEVCLETLEDMKGDFIKLSQTIVLDERGKIKFNLIKTLREMDLVINGL